MCDFNISSSSGFLKKKNICTPEGRRNVHFGGNTTLRQCNHCPLVRFNIHVQNWYIVQTVNGNTRLSETYIITCSVYNIYNTKTCRFVQEKKIKTKYFQQKPYNNEDESVLHWNGHIIYILLFLNFIIISWSYLLLNKFLCYMILIKVTFTYFSNTYTNYKGEYQAFALSISLYLQLLIQIINI